MNYVGSPGVGLASDNNDMITKRRLTKIKNITPMDICNINWDFITTS